MTSPRWVVSSAIRGPECRTPALSPDGFWETPSHMPRFEEFQESICHQLSWYGFGVIVDNSGSTVAAAGAAEFILWRRIGLQRDATAVPETA